MSDLKKYSADRKKTDKEFAENYDQGYENLKVGVMLKEARLDMGLTQQEIATILGTKKATISRIENHAEDVKLSTLERYAAALGKTIILLIQ